VACGSFYGSCSTVPLSPQTRKPTAGDLGTECAALPEHQTFVEENSSARSKPTLRDGNFFHVSPDAGLSARRGQEAVAESHSRWERGHSAVCCAAKQKKSQWQCDNLAVGAWAEAVPGLGRGCRALESLAPLVQGSGLLLLPEAHHCLHSTLEALPTFVEKKHREPANCCLIRHQQPRR
jgi:hypothetical protein